MLIEKIYKGSGCNPCYLCFHADTLLDLHCSLIRLNLDYCCIIYGAAKTFYIIKTRDAIHHQGLRLPDNFSNLSC